MTKFNSIILTGIILVTSLTTSVKQVNAQGLVLQSSFNVSDTLKSGGNVGIAYLGNEYWVSKFTNDSIYRLNSAGRFIDRFIVAGVTAPRSITWDGTFVYAGLNSTTIAKINPVTKTLVTNITAPVQTRYVTYEATANNGAGGLWIGHAATDFYLINLSGDTLKTILHETHNIPIVYGLTYDSTRAGGGPFLWAFDQGEGASANLIRIPVSTGVPDYSYNVLKDFPTVAGGVAGGLFMSYNINPGQRTLIALLQGVPSLAIRYLIPSVLPISLLSFTGEKTGLKNSLKWITASEQNNKGFEVQRSANGINFNPVSFVASKAVNSNSVSNLSYSFTDESPLKGNNYYRLAQVDKDGKLTYSSTVILKASSVVKAEIAGVFPNPVTSVLNISVNTPTDDKITFLIADMKGTALIKQSSQIAYSGNNLFAIRVQNLAAGTYILKAFGSEGQSISETKFIKQ